MHNIIFPEDIREPPPRRERGAKPFSIIAPPKHREDVQYFHCPRHKGLRLLSIAGGYICPFCGPTLPSIKIVDTVDQEKKG